MRWLLFAVCMLLYLAAGLLGYWVGKKKSKKVVTIFAATCLVFILARSFFRYFPMVEFTLFPFDLYAVIRPWWAIPFAMAILGVGVSQMSTSFSRKGVGVFAVGLFLVCGQRLLTTALFDPSTMTGVVMRDGVCPQTTDYTCGASAAATLLAHYGIEASEREMAERCWTNSLTGTDEFCVARGLRQKLAGSGRVVRIRPATWEELAARTEPVMVTIKFQFLVDHWVVVFSASDKRVIVGDPLAGKQGYSKTQFLEKWRGVMVTAEPE